MHLCNACLVVLFLIYVIQAVRFPDVLFLVTSGPQLQDRLIAVPPDIYFTVSTFARNYSKAVYSIKEIRKARTLKCII